MSRNEDHRADCGCAHCLGFAPDPSPVIAAAIATERARREAENAALVSQQATAILEHLDGVLDSGEPCEYRVLAGIDVARIANEEDWEDVAEEVARAASWPVNVRICAPRTASGWLVEVLAPQRGDDGDAAHDLWNDGREV